MRYFIVKSLFRSFLAGIQCRVVSKMHKSRSTRSPSLCLETAVRSLFSSECLSEMSF